VDTLAAALARIGRFKEARQSADRALQIAKARGKSEWISVIESRLRLYTDGKAYADPPGKKKKWE
jgi:hypothetical protein